jgi:hypothetical protein
MAKDPREQQHPDAERIPDDRPGRLDTDVDRVEEVDDDDVDLDDEDLDEDDPDDEDLEEV